MHFTTEQLILIKGALTDLPRENDYHREFLEELGDKVLKEIDKRISEPKCALRK